MCYTFDMVSEIGVRELRNEVSDVLRRVEAGEEFIVTVSGRPVAVVSGLDKRFTTMPKETFIAAMSKLGTDPGLLDELGETLSGTIDEIDPWSDS